LVPLVGCDRLGLAQTVEQMRYLLAVLTEQGVGVERDAAVAAGLYRHAAERGQRSAQLRWALALMERRGRRIRMTAWVADRAQRGGILPGEIVFADVRCQHAQHEVT
jgi:TPR repeat protein